jgi:asparagine N-glycosylation enzyme membrane subunit Stt3
MFAPGVLLAFALLAGVQLGRLEKALVGVILGLLVVPALCVLELLAFGLLFDAALVFANCFLVAAASIALLYKQGQLARLSLPPLKLEVTREGTEKWFKENWVLLAIVIITLVGFYVRFAGSWSTDFFEFDPIYYDKLTERLVNGGVIQAFTQESYFPLQAFQRYAPMIHYLTGSWFVLYKSILGLAYSNDLLMLIAQLYTPLVGALLSFLAFIMVREEYNKYFALVPAALFAFTPQLIKKLAAGVNEQQPFGIFTAMLLFAFLILAVNRRSRRLALLTALAAFAAVLGSQQYIWPLMVVSGYIIIQSVLDFLAGETDRRLLEINAMVVAGAVAGNVVLSVYQEAFYTPLVTTASLTLVGALAFSAALYAVATRARSRLAGFNQRALCVGGVVFVALVLSAVTPVGATVLGYVVRTTQFAVTGSALGKTIQEEGATNEGFFASAYGALNPPMLLKIAALLSAFSMVVTLLSKGKKTAAAAGALVVAALVLLNVQVDAALTWIAGGSGSAALADLTAFFVQNDVFLYMLIALAATSATYFYSDQDKKSEVAVLFILVFFPVAYIGLNKLKYMVQLAGALCLVVGFILGEALRSIEGLNDWLKIASDKAFVARAAIAALFLLGIVVVGLQARTVGQSMLELSNTRITPDWIEGYKWMRENVPRDARIISWWDYGHWTTFFGERATVLDPNNNYANFDQGVARAFVDGKNSNLYSRMAYHNATHALVDADLIGKWGALVFLSGTCSSNESPICPANPEIDWRAGPGKSKYEAEHYYEYITVVGNCPLSASPVSLPALSSSFGGIYCAGKSELFLLTRTGALDEKYKRSYKIIGRDEVDAAHLDANTSYLFAVGQNQFINANPDLSYGGLNNRVFYSAFTRLFFFETLPGFKLIHKTPNGQVKIFEYTGPQSESESPLPTPSATPAASPSATPPASPSASPSPSSSPSPSLSPSPSSPSTSPSPSPSHSP